MKTSTYTKVGDIPFNYQFVSDSQDTTPIREHFGVFYDSFFVRIEDGDYLHVYGMNGIIPLLNKTVYQVK